MSSLAQAQDPGPGAETCSQDLLTSLNLGSGPCRHTWKIYDDACPVVHTPCTLSLGLSCVPLRDRWTDSPLHRPPASSLVSLTACITNDRRAGHLIASIRRLVLALRRFLAGARRGPGPVGLRICDLCLGSGWRTWAGRNPIELARHGRSVQAPAAPARCMLIELIISNSSAQACAVTPSASATGATRPYNTNPSPAGASASDLHHPHRFSPCPCPLLQAATSPSLAPAASAAASRSCGSPVVAP